MSKKRYPTFRRKKTMTVKAGNRVIFCRILTFCSKVIASCCPCIQHLLPLSLLSRNMYSTGTVTRNQSNYCFHEYIAFTRMLPGYDSVSRLNLFFLLEHSHLPLISD